MLRRVTGKTSSLQALVQDSLAVNYFSSHDVGPYEPHRY